jgi:hypothetical protein
MSIPGRALEVVVFRLGPGGAFTWAWSLKGHGNVSARRYHSEAVALSMARCWLLDMLHIERPAHLRTCESESVPLRYV